MPSDNILVGSWIHYRIHRDWFAPLAMTEPEGIEKLHVLLEIKVYAYPIVSRIVFRFIHIRYWCPIVRKETPV